MKILLVNAGSDKYRHAEVKPGDAVRLCVWNEGVFIAEVERVGTCKLTVRGERLGQLSLKGSFEFALSKLCYVEKITKGA